MWENFTTRLGQANLASKNDVANFGKKTDFDDQLKDLNKKVTSNKSKHLLVENEFKKLLKSFYLSKPLLQWWSTTLLNISTALIYFKSTKQ